MWAKPRESVPSDAGAQQIAAELFARLRPFTIYRLSSELDRIVPPRIIEEVDPEYSEGARVASLEGSVRIASMIGEDGSVQEARVRRGLGLGLDEKAVEAVRKWKFSPEPSSPSPLPARVLRWSLAPPEFQPSEGASRPIIVSAPFPPGLSPQAAELIRTYREPPARGASVSFEVDEQGFPERFRVVTAVSPAGEKKQSPSYEIGVSLPA